MAGQDGYNWIADRAFEDLTSLKKHARLQGRVQEVRFFHTVATGGAGASIEIEEKTGTTVTRLTTGNEGQVYIRAHTDNGAYENKTITLSWLDEAGVVHDPVTTTLDDNAITEVAVSGATDFYRPRPFYPYTNAVIQAGHTLSIGDDNHANDGSGNDLWGVIEEGNYNSIHSRYYVPLEDSNGKAIYSYLAKMRAKYAGNQKGDEDRQYATLTVTCTPNATGYQTTLPYRVYAGETFVWEEPFRLKAATDTIFTVADDAGDGGNFEFEYIIVESTRIAPG